MRSVIVGLLIGGSLAPCAAAQSNTINGLDAKLNTIGGLLTKAHTGTYPSGTTALAFDTNICNVGSVGIEWKRAMNPNHPFISFIIGRELNGRFEQISDRSDVKHTFFATNQSDCSSCTNSSDPTVLAVGCSDTYGSNENGDRYWLAPAAEVDPWLGLWDPVCSHFDQGEPVVAPPADCDGARSLTRGDADALGPLKHRVRVRDGDLNASGATFWFWSQYVVRGEADALRDDTGGSRGFVPTWTGTTWTFSVNGSLLHGTILQNWTGAKIDSNSNGADDGRVFVASLVTGPDASGLYHYEYALHNRDNSRGISALRIPICPGATVTNAGSSDVDNDPSNKWSFQAGAADLLWSTSSNPLEWNTIYNFWFDCDAPPADGCRALLQEYRTGDGLDAFDVRTTAPMGPAVGTDVGYGLAGGSGLAPDLTLCGGLNLGETAQVMLRDAAPSAPVFIFVSDQNAGLGFHGGTILPWPPGLIIPGATDAAGEFLEPVDGVGGTFDLFMQFVVLDAAAPNGVAMSNAVEVTL